MCDDVLWLRHGQAADRGDPKRVVDAYLTYVAGGEEALLRSREATAAEDAAAPGSAAAGEAPLAGAIAPAGGGAARSRSAPCASSTAGAGNATSSFRGRP